MEKFKHSFKYGAIAGAIMITSWFITSLMLMPGGTYDFSKGEIVGYVSMFLALTVVFVGIKKYRDHQLNGIIAFSKAFLVGLQIVLVASVIYVVGWMIYYPNFMPDFADQYADFQLQEYREAGLNESEIATRQYEMKEWMEMYKNPVIMAGFTFLEIFPIGLIVALISAAVLKKTSPTQVE